MNFKIKKKLMFWYWIIVIPMILIYYYTPIFSPLFKHLFEAFGVGVTWGIIVFSFLKLLGIKDE